MCFIVAAHVQNPLVGNQESESLPVIIGVHETKEQAKSAVKMHSPQVMSGTYIKLVIHELGDKSKLAGFGKEELKSQYEELRKAQEKQAELEKKLKELQSKEQELQQKINETHAKYPGFSSLPKLQPQDKK